MRKARIIAAACFWLAMASADAAAETHQVFMKTSGPTCRDFSGEPLARWTCAGPGDYLVTFSDEGNLASVEFGRRGTPFANDKSGSVWRGAEKVFGDVLEWRTGSEGIPVAAILRVWETDDGGKAVQSLKVFALNADSACVFASVPANVQHANEKAARQAARAAGWRCSAGIR